MFCLSVSKLPSALSPFLGAMPGEGLEGEGEEERDDLPLPSGEDLAALCSSLDQAMMQDCYSKIVEKLSSANPTMVVQVETSIFVWHLYLTRQVSWKADS